MISWKAAFSAHLLLWTVATATQTTNTTSNATEGHCAWFDNASHNPQDKVLYNLVKQYDIPQNTFGATVLALLYSTSLNLYNSSQVIFPTNSLTVESAPAGGNSSKPAPNTDVIYGYMLYDLGERNLVLHFPPYQNDRFYGFAFYDPFQETYETIGVVRGNPAGDYLLRPSLGSGRYGISTVDCPRQYTGCINSPTYVGRVVNRVELFNPSDTDYVLSYLHNITVRESARTSARVASLSPDEFDNVSSNKFVNALEVVSILGSRNPPQDPAFSKSLPGLMQCAGVDFKKQKYTPVPGVNLTEAAEMWQNITDVYLTLPTSVQHFKNDWDAFNSTVIGSFLDGTDIVGRAEYQVLGNLPNTADQCIYTMPTNVSLNVGNDEAYMLTFNGKPPLSEFGFWNLEVYQTLPSGVGGLVQNPQGIYSVGKNTNITYADGTLVYTTNTTKPDSTPFQILFQSADNPPPANWTSNWMPTPTDGSLFRITMRLYAEDEAQFVNGQYNLPTQTQIPAITSN